jgi:gluconokinase
MSAGGDGGPVAVVVMGVAGAGKTTVCEALAKACGLAFIDGDALHPKANIEKMASGHPLTDADRAPWLAAIAAWIDARLAEGRSCTVSCSALKRAYRDQLRVGRSGVRLVMLEGSREVIAERIAGRKGHFWPQGLLDTQFADLEPPQPDEGVLVVGIDKTVDEQVAQIAKALGLSDRASKD